MNECPMYPGAGKERDSVEKGKKKGNHHHTFKFARFVGGGGGCFGHEISSNAT